jgi:hypothetical protein
MLKKVFLLIGLSLNTVSSFAMPVLNPADPALLDRSLYLPTCENLGIKLGYRGDFIFNRNFRNHYQEVDYFSLYSNQVVVVLTLWDRLDVYGFGGPASYDFNMVNNSSNSSIKGASGPKTLWGTGLKAIIYEKKWCDGSSTYLSIDGQYEGMATNLLKFVKINEQKASTNDFGYYYREAQVSLGLAHRITQLVPYIAAKWSNGRLSINNSDIIGQEPNSVVLDKLKSNRHWGYAFGVTYVDADKMSVTAEARFVDETALSIGASLRF